MTLVGSGGAATPIAIQAALEGLEELTIFARHDEFYSKAVENVKIINEEMKHVSCKAKLYSLEDTDRLREEIRTSDILTNGTGVGMKPLEEFSIIEDISMLRPDLIVTDVVYMPMKSKLLEQAESIGCHTVNGIGMMIWQGAMAFELWTGKEMPVEYIKEQMFEPSLQY